MQVVARAGVGLDNIDVAAADDLGVVVVAALGANAASVAEHAIGLALSLARGTVGLDAQVRSGTWQRSPGTELSGGTWGLLGAGATARATGRLARGLGMDVLAYDPYVSPDHPEVRTLGISLTDLADVLGRADVLSIHLPSTPETVGLLDARRLARLKASALLVNVGRGEVIDESALAAALSAGQLAGAALDVRACEPPMPGPLERCPGVILTPHIAGITRQSQLRINEILCANIAGVLSFQEATHAVTSSARPRRAVA